MNEPLWITVDGTAVATGSLRALVRELMRHSGIGISTGIEAARELKERYDEQAALRKNPFGSYYCPLIRWFEIPEEGTEYPNHIGLAYSKVHGKDTYQWELYYALA